jgi:hypothetical protein
MPARSVDFDIVDESRDAQAARRKDHQRLFFGGLRHLQV